jgi:hypothetical protein
MPFSWYIVDSVRQNLLTLREAVAASGRPVPYEHLQLFWTVTRPFNSLRRNWTRASARRCWKPKFIRRNTSGR